MTTTDEARVTKQIELCRAMHPDDVTHVSCIILWLADRLAARDAELAKLREAFDVETKWRTSATDEVTRLLKERDEMIALLEDAPLGGSDERVIAFVDARRRLLAKLRGGTP